MADLQTAGPAGTPTSDLERLRQENAALRQELERLRAGAPLKTVLGMAEALLLVGPDGNVAYANSATEKLYGKERSALLGRPLAALEHAVAGGAALDGIVAEARATASSVHRELMADARNPAEARCYGVTASPTSAGVQLVIADRSELRRMQLTFSRYLSPQVMQTVLQSGVDPYQARKYELTVLFADLRGFTSMSSKLPAEQVKRLIDEYLTVQIDTVMQEGATLDKIVGDEVMVLFGAPVPAPHHAAWAINVALKMIEGHRRLMGLWAQRGDKPCGMGIGINSGEMVVGPIGSTQQMNYTVLGHNVNLAARLCSAAAAGEILLAPRTFELARDHLSTHPDFAWRPMKFHRGKVVQAKGIDEPVQTVNVSIVEEGG